jgi:hypothetical protein
VKRRTFIAGLGAAAAWPVVTVVVPGQRSEDDEGAVISGSVIAAVEPSVTEEPSQTAALQTEAKAAAEFPPQTGTAEAQIEAAEPAPVAPESSRLRPV